MVVQQAEEDVKRIGDAAKQTEAVEKDLRKKLKAFRGTMSNLGDVEVDHDKKTIEQMQSKLFALQQSHESTMNWANMDRCRTDAWSSTVDRSVLWLSKTFVVSV